MLFSYMLFMVVLLVVFFAILAGLEQPAVKIADGSALTIDLGLNITDTPPEPNPLEPLLKAMGEDQLTSISLKKLTDSIRAAASDNQISSLYLHGYLLPDGYGTSYAALREVRAALAEFQKSGKKVVAYTDAADIRDIYLLSQADELHLHPLGIVNFAGLASEMMYFGRAFEKYGIGVQQATVGRYKSAGEMFTRDSMSPEDREARTALLQGIWQSVLEEVAASRKMYPATLQQIAEEDGLLDAARARELGFVDRLSNFDEVLQRMEELAGRDEDLKSFQQVSVQDYATRHKNPLSLQKKEGPQVAIVYAEGVIVDGEGAIDQVGGDRLARRLRRLRQDDAVRAVVLRINSPGGSAQASEVILRELQMLREKKPVVVSMGGLAASGGYWISLGADRIFAEPSTITGSIGVVMLVPHIQELAGNLGVTFDSVRTAPLADMLTISRPKTEKEMTIFRRFASSIYESFIERVSAARQLPLERVREIAEGRVWVGSDALRLGLVDEMGGLTEALAYAVQKAGLGDDYQVREVPREKNLAEALNEWFEQNVDARFRGPAGYIWRQVKDDLALLQALNDPRHTYLLLPFHLHLR